MGGVYVVLLVLALLFILGKSMNTPRRAFMTSREVEKFLLYTDEHKVRIYGEKYADSMLDHILRCATTCNWSTAVKEEPFTGIVHRVDCFMYLLRQLHNPN